MLTESTIAAAKSEAASYVRRMHQDEMPAYRRQVLSVRIFQDFEFKVL